jgi:heterodisulfide reductase subunit A-like polyferredoxin
MHERTFRRACREAGLNPYLFEMATSVSSVAGYTVKEARRRPRK